MAWSETNGVKVPANIIPTSTSDTYPTHHANFGRGGYKTVNSIEERDNIPVDRLTLGTEVRVTLADGTSTVYYVSKMPATISHNSTGKDCEWTLVEAGGFDEEALEAIKGKPGGLAELDVEGKVPVSQSRAIIFRGYYVDELVFNGTNGIPCIYREDALYIDNNNGRIYTYTNGKFVRDALYWQNV